MTRYETGTLNDVPLNISKGLVENLLQKADEILLTVSDIFDYDLPNAPKTTFEILNCHECGEVVAVNKARVKDGNFVCLSCSGY